MIVFKCSLALDRCPCERGRNLELNCIISKKECQHRNFFVFHLFSKLISSQTIYVKMMKRSMRRRQATGKQVSEKILDGCQCKNNKLINFNTEPWETRDQAEWWMMRRNQNLNNFFMLIKPDRLFWFADRKGASSSVWRGNFNHDLNLSFDKIFNTEM